jgi:hypothetical protein
MKMRFAMVAGVAAMTVGFVLGRMTTSHTQASTVSLSARSHTEAQSQQRDSILFSEHGPSQSLRQEKPRELTSVLHAAVKNGEDDVMANARGNIANYIDNDLQRAMEVLGWFRSETDPTALNLLMASISANPDVAADPEILAAFLEIARSDVLSSRRVAAVTFLGQGASQPPELDRELIELVHADADAEIRSAAIAALRQRGEIDAMAAQRLNPELIETAGVQSDPAVRQQALQAVRVRELSEHQLHGMLGFLKDETPAVRITAAEQLGDARPQHRIAALNALSETVRFDARSDVRRACLLSMVKVARKESLTTLRQLRDVDPELTQEIDDYVAILANGDVDLESILDEKRKLEAIRPASPRAGSGVI